MTRRTAAENLVLRAALHRVRRTELLCRPQQEEAAGTTQQEHRKPPQQSWCCWPRCRKAGRLSQEAGRVAFIRAYLGNVSRQKGRIVVVFKQQTGGLREDRGGRWCQSDRSPSALKRTLCCAVVWEDCNCTAINTMSQFYNASISRVG